MNVLFWNIRGITAPGRKTCILDTLAKVKPSIVAFQETKKSDLSNSFLKSISLNRNYVWHQLPAKGSAGGILMGVDADIFDITSWIDKELDRFITPALLKKLQYDLQDHSVIWPKINNHRRGKHPRKTYPL